MNKVIIKYVFTEDIVFNLVGTKDLTLSPLLQ